LTVVLVGREHLQPEEVVEGPAELVLGDPVDVHLDVLEEDLDPLPP